MFCVKRNQRDEREEGKDQVLVNPALAGQHRHFIDSYIFLLKLHNKQHTTVSLLHPFSAADGVFPYVNLALCRFN